MRVSPNGGKPEVLVDLNDSEDGAFGPQLLPDGDTLLFTIAKRTSVAINRWDDAQIVVQSLKTRVRKALIEGGTDARYVPTGHIVYMSGGTLFAVPFDLPKLEVTGGAVPVVEGIRREDFSTDLAHYAFSNSGSLVYVPGPTWARAAGLGAVRSQRRRTSRSSFRPGGYSSRGCLPMASGSRLKPTMEE